MTRAAAAAPPADAGRPTETEASAPPPFLVDVAAEVERFFDDSSKTTGEKPRFGLLLGGVSSGKTYTRRRRYRHAHVIVDAAEIFVSLSRGGYYDFPDGLKDPLETIGSLVALRALGERRNVVTEMLAVDRAPIDALFQAMTGLGYHVDVVWIDCDPAVAAQRNANRGDLDISSAFCQEFHVRWLLAAAAQAGPQRPH